VTEGSRLFEGTFGTIAWREREKERVRNGTKCLSI